MRDELNVRGVSWPFRSEVNCTSFHEDFRYAETLAALQRPLNTDGESLINLQNVVVSVHRSGLIVEAFYCER